jgi:uncharacterized LabA/DUF88 family protein
VLACWIVLRLQRFFRSLKSEHLNYDKKKLLDYKNKQITLQWTKYEEKETDVNLSIYMVRDAIKRSFDKIILITNDTDMVPAVKMARAENNGIQFKLLCKKDF